ncbi:DUF418 domain-containing protein [Streptomyces sp. BE303]|uniref:DUF418 domain-containing protein n=1 Tax=Streptomyces sp. BE303 TaxID=3002528 RepID=UPI002E7A921F|nr:DUF418 domain-containing protein [Streptomyces sp. BE303]MED7952099.1 DUF418 domain-containing protein [Streptomyces sp. BE303]
MGQHGGGTGGHAVRSEAGDREKRGRRGKPEQDGTEGARGTEGTEAGRAAPARLADVDALRGFALFGILTVNITYLASAYHGTGVEEPGFGSPLDTGVRLLVALLFEAKFFLLFSFLFGYSFTLQLDSAERRGARFTPRFLRRLAGLFVLGVLHAVVLFPGDILTTYAVLGLILLALRRLRPRTAVRTAVVLFTVTSAAYLLLAVALRGADGGDRAVLAADAQQATEALRGGFGSVVGAHLDQLPDVLFLLAFFQAPAALAAFLLGLAAGRQRALAEPGRHDRTLRRLQVWGFPLGLLGAAVYTYSALRNPGASFQVFALGVDVITAPLLAAAYAATVLRIARGRHGRRMVAVLAPPGRMTLTNYLTQSLVCVLLFTGVGVGLIGRVPPSGVALIGVALFAAQAVFCRWWLARHPYGPVEWLLRAVTTLSRPRWRGSAGAADTADTATAGAAGAVTGPTGGPGAVG